MAIINQILRGIIIGMANIIPGVSGGTMMVSMGIYDTLIHCITHIFKEFVKSIKTLLPYAIGMLVGIVALASVLKWAFESYPLPTSTLFIGLILGGLPILLKRIDRKKLSAVAIIVFVIFFALIITLALIPKPEATDTLVMSFGQVFVLIAVGIIAAATMIIPGVSGSMILMLLGYYKPVLNAVSGLKDALFQFSLPALGSSLAVLLPFGVGVAVGIFGVAKLIEWLLAKYPTPTYCGVMGLVVASPIAILLSPDSGVSGASWVMILISLATFIVGFLFAAWLSKGAKDNGELSAAK